MVQVVLLHELVEEVGTEHHRLGNLHGDTGELPELRMTLHHIVEERQSAPLAP